MDQRGSVAPRPRAGRREAPRVRVAVLGGTFDHLHAGHRALLEAAFRRAGEVRIGLTTDRFVRQERKPLARNVQRYAVRARYLKHFLRRRFPDKDWTVVPLRDRWGGSVGPGVDLIVLSEETRNAARTIATERQRRGLPRLDVVIVPLVRADDGRPIASRRIRAGQIDSEGRRRRVARRGRSRATKH